MLGVATTTCGGGRGGFAVLSSSAVFNSKANRRVAEIIKSVKDDPSKSRVKIAILSATKKEGIKLPDYEDGCGGKQYQVSEFLNHPAGVETILNVNALEKYEALDYNTYRCRIPAIHFLNFDVAPVLDLRINPTTEDCTVEMLSCKLEGSDIIEHQNKQFSASMTNHITWKKHASEAFLYVDVKLNIQLKSDASSVGPLCSTSFTATITRL